MIFLSYGCQFPPLTDHLFNLRFAAKELERNAKRCEKQEKDEKNKLTAALKVRGMSKKSLLAEMNTFCFRKGTEK